MAAPKHVPMEHQHNFNKGRDSIRLFNTLPTAKRKQNNRRNKNKDLPLVPIDSPLVPRKQKTPSQCWS